MQQITGRYCRECDRQTKHERATTQYQQFSVAFGNIFMTLITCGLWIPVWILVAIIGRPAWICSRCGSKN